MAIKTQAQIQAESNSTYVDNSVGAITPNSVRTLNTNWIDSVLFVQATASMNVKNADTASFVTGNVASASFAQTAANAQLLDGLDSTAFAQLAQSNTFSNPSGQSISGSLTLGEPLSGNAVSMFADSSNNNQLNVNGDVSILAPFGFSGDGSRVTGVITSSLALNNVVTASATANIITFTKGNGSTFNVTVAQSGSVASASYADFANVANFATSASYAFTASSAIRSTSSSFAVTASYALNVPDTASFAISSSRAISAETAISASFATTASYALNVPNTASFAISASRAISSETASFVSGYAALAGNNVYTGTNQFNNAVTMSNVVVTGTASIAFLDVTFQSSSVIYSSGSNQFGDAANDTQTLYGTVNVITGPLVVTGSANFRNVITGSITSASFATSASSAINAVTASFLLGTVASASFATSASRAISAATATTASYALFSLAAGSTTSSLSSSAIYIEDALSNVNPFYVTFTQGYTGDWRRLFATSNLTYTPATNVLSATVASSTSASFATSASRAISAATATSASFATTSITASLASSASSITIDNYNGSNTTYYLTMVDNASGFKRVGLDTDLAYNPSTNLLTGLITSASFATSASRAISAESATLAATASSADVFVVRTNLTASGLNYPSTDGLVDQFLTTNGSGNLSFSNLDTILEDVVSGEGFTKGDPLYISGSSGAKPIVYKADASDASKMPVTYVAYETVPTSGINTRGIVLGLIEGVNLTGYTAGDEIYVAEGGGWTSTRPTGSNSIVQFLGVVTKEGAGGKGLVLNPGPATLPNLQSGYAWVGDANNQPVAVATSSFAGASAAFPFTGSARITGSLDVIGRLYVPSGSFEITGSATINSGSLIMYSYKNPLGAARPFIAMVTQSLNSTNNIISISQTTAQSGSIVISGSGNYVSLTGVQTNLNFANGATSGFNGQNAYVTIMPVISGSNPLVNTAADRNNRFVPTLVNSNINGTLTVTDNRQTESSNPVTFSSVNQLGGFTVRIDSGSLSTSQTLIAGLTNVLEITGSGTTAINNSTLSNTIFIGNGNNIIYRATGSGTTGINNSIIQGNSNRILITTSSSLNSTTVTNPIFNNSLIVGQTLIVTGSTNTANGMTLLGNFNTADGLLNDSRFTTFAVGTGTSAAARGTAFHVSASGMTTANVGLNVRGNQTGSTELEVRETGVKIGNLLTDSHNLTGSFSITGSQIITGSLVGQPVSQSVSSNTASLDLRLGNFFNLTLPASTNTFITASGQIPGQTINLKITQGATTGSVTFGSGIKQVSGSAYTVTATANAVDIVTFISFDETGLYMSNVKNLI